MPKKVNSSEMTVCVCVSVCRQRVGYYFFVVISSLFRSAVYIFFCYCLFHFPCNSDLTPIYYVVAVLKIRLVSSSSFSPSTFFRPFPFAFFTSVIIFPNHRVLCSKTNECNSIRREINVKRNQPALESM